MNKKKCPKPIYKYMYSLFTIISILLLIMVYAIDVLPILYFIGIFFLVLVVNLFTRKFLYTKNNKLKIIGVSSFLLFLIIYILGSVYLVNTYNFFNMFGKSKEVIEKYYLYVLNDSDVKDISELSEMIYIDTNTIGLDEAIEKLQTDNSNISFVDVKVGEIIDYLNEDNAVLIEESIKNLILENDIAYFENFKEIYSFIIKYESNINTDEVNILEDPFNIYITGVDTYNGVSSNARSDVNLILTVNVLEGEVLMTSIPRDYYVYVPEFDEKDKLTHTGIYGIETSIETIEHLLDIDINYYAKVNFTALTSVVDALDGIEINSNYSFTSKDGYYFKKGLQEINGEEALSFVRERDSFLEGDRVRIQNQQIVLEGIIDKTLSSTILTKYNDVLKSIEDDFETNFSGDEISDAIKYQLETLTKWNITNYELKGTDFEQNQFTYTYPNQRLYAMNPDIDSIVESQSLIKSILNK